MSTKAGKGSQSKSASTLMSNVGSGSAESAGQASATKSAKSPLQDAQAVERIDDTVGGSIHDEDQGELDRMRENRKAEEEYRGVLDQKREALKLENKMLIDRAGKWDQATTDEQKVAVLENLLLSAHNAKENGQSAVTTVKLFLTRTSAGVAAIQRYETAVRAQPIMTPVEAVRAVAAALRMQEMTMPAILRLVNVLDVSGQEIVEEAQGTLGDRIARARALAEILSGRGVTMEETLQQIHVPLRQYVAQRNQNLSRSTSPTFVTDWLKVIELVDDLVRNSQKPAAPAVVATSLVASRRTDKGRRNRDGKGKDGKRVFQGKCYNCGKWGHVASVCTAAAPADTTTPVASATASTPAPPVTAAPSVIEVKKTVSARYDDVGDF